MIYPLVICYSYGKWTIEIDVLPVLPIKMVIFNSYVSLPEGRSRMLVLGATWNGSIKYCEQAITCDYFRKFLFHRTQLLFRLKTTVCLVFRHNLTMLDHCAPKYLLKICRISQGALVGNTQFSWLWGCVEHHSSSFILATHAVRISHGSRIGRYLERKSFQSIASQGGTKLKCDPKPATRM